MKSIMEEASTIFKAIEKAWILAEKPQSFSVKVLEEPEKNFFGMTTKSAKIALLFEESTNAGHHKQKNVVQAPQAKRTQPAGQPQREPAKRPAAQSARTHEQPRASEQPRERREQKEQQRPVRQQKQPEQAPRQEHAETQNVPEAVWSPEMNAWATKWVQTCVGSLNSAVNFSSTIQKNQLVIEFDKPIVDNGRDRLLFSSLAHLMMQSLRHEYKNQTRGLKVVLKLQN